MIRRASSTAETRTISADLASAISGTFRPITERTCVEGSGRFPKAFPHLRFLPMAPHHTDDSCFSRNGNHPRHKWSFSPSPSSPPARGGEIGSKLLPLHTRATIASFAPLRMIHEMIAVKMDHMIWDFGYPYLRFPGDTP